MGKKGFTEEEWQIVTKTIYDRAVEYSKHRIYPIDSIFPPFKAEMKELGFEFEISMQLKQLCQQNSEITRDTVLKYYQICIYANEKAFLMSCLKNKNNKDLVPFFIEEFYKAIDITSTLRDMTGNCLLKTADIKYKDDYLELLKKTKGDNNSKGFILEICGKLKIREAIPLMIDIIDEENMCGFVLNALNKYKDPNLLPIFKKYENDKDTVYRNAAKKGITNIEKILNKGK